MNMPKRYKIAGLCLAAAAIAVITVGAISNAPERVTTPLLESAAPVDVNPRAEMLADITTWIDPVPDHILVAGLNCARRVFIDRDGSSAYGTFSRGLGGWLSVDHVTGEGGDILIGPQVEVIERLQATDFSFLTGSDPQTDPDSVPPLEGRVTIVGFPAGSVFPRMYPGRVFAPDTTPPAVWVLLDGFEPTIGGQSGGCVLNEDGEIVAVIMGTSSMPFESEVRRFGRVIPLRAALREIQGHEWTAPVGLAGKRLPPMPQIPLLEKNAEEAR